MRRLRQPHQAHDPNRYPSVRNRAGANGKRKDFVVTVVTEHFVQVNALDEAQARRMVERTVVGDFGGPTRNPTIVKVEALS